MSPLKRALLSAYYHGTLPFRRLANARAARRGRAPVMVLFYHRVADERSQGWTLSNDDFDAHLEWLRGNFDLVSFEEAQRRVRSGVNYRPAVSISFDDGYADNCEHALPLLLRHRIPCTYFVTVNNVFFGDPFPHDLALGRPLRPNTLEQLRTLAAAGIEIGAHTRTHADLGRLHDVNRIRDEVVEATRDLQAAMNRPVRYFAFPYGLHANLSSAAIQQAREFGFEGVCSAYGGYNFPGDDPFHLQRIHGDGDLLLLKNWLTVDPRKRFVKRFREELPKAPGSAGNPSRGLRIWNEEEPARP